MQRPGEPTATPRTATDTIPGGSIIDVGRIRLTVARPDATTDFVEAYGGAFKML